VINQDVPHLLCGNCEEMSPILIFRLAIKDPKVCLMDQTRRVQRVVWPPLFPHHGGRSAPQLLIGQFDKA
jgi:hypothetical protein